MKNHFKAVILLSLVTGETWASQYAIQLEASKSPYLERFEVLSNYGSLYTETADNGYIRTRLGPYESKRKTLDTLRYVHEEGFTDAIIVKHRGNIITQPASSSRTIKRQSDFENIDVKTLKEWNMLTPEQQKKLVYLDGELHVKDGDNFIPLDEITGQN